MQARVQPVCHFFCNPVVEEDGKNAGKTIIRKIYFHNTVREFRDEERFWLWEEIEGQFAKGRIKYAMLLRQVGTNDGFRHILRPTEFKRLSVTGAHISRELMEIPEAR